MQTKKKCASMHLDSELSSTKLTRNISAAIFFFDTYFISLWPTAIYVLLCAMRSVK